MQFTSSFDQMGVSIYRSCCLNSIIESQRPGILCNEVKLMHFLFAPGQLPHFCKQRDISEIKYQSNIGSKISIIWSESSILFFKKGKNYYELHDNMLFVICCCGRVRKVIWSSVLKRSTIWSTLVFWGSKSYDRPFWSTFV